MKLTYALCLQTYEVPADESIQVEAGDFVGIHYDKTVTDARVRILMRLNATAGEGLRGSRGKGLGGNTADI